MVEFFKVYRSSFEKTRFKNSKEVDPACEHQEEVETGHHVVEGESIKLLVERSASKEEERPPKERLLPRRGKKRRGEEEGGRGGGGSDFPPPPKT